MEQMDTVIVQPMGTPLIKIMQEQLGKSNIAIFNHVKKFKLSISSHWYDRRFLTLEFQIF